jgi:C4-dicarboxylate transporter DctM subunit
MSHEVIAGCVGLLGILFLFFTGLELPFSMILVGFIGFGYLRNFDAATHMMAKDLYDTFVNYSFTVFPIFILMGQVAFASGMAKRLYDGAYRFIGHIPGGLAMATVGGATAFKALCGSAIATVATFTKVAIPEMDRYHYSKTLSTGLVATVGTLGCLIPPSVVLIIYGILTEQSIGRLFLAGIIPGLAIAFLFVCTIFAWAKISPDLAPAGEKSSWKQRIATIPEMSIILIIFLLMIVGLLQGFFTPTEAGSVGTVVVLLMVVVRRQLPFREYAQATVDSMLTAVMILLLVGGSGVLGRFIAISTSPQLMSDWVAVLPLNRNIIMVIICLIYIIGGSFIDDLAFMILATPIFFPTVQKLGFDPVWFGIMMGVTQMVGLVIPPVASAVFIVHKLSGTPMSTVYKGALPFLIGIIIVAVLLFAFPQIALFLPQLLMN